MTVVKRTKKASAGDLVSALHEFVPLLRGQNEDEAADDLEKAAQALSSEAPESESFMAAIKSVVEAFDGDHELSAYTMAPKEPSPDQWTEKEQLYLASTRVYNLSKRFLK